MLNYASLLGSINVQAALRVIREGESSQLDDGPHSAYRAMYHPTRRVYYEHELRGAPHPRRFEYLPDNSGRKSSAFGAYQFTATTWAEIGERYGLADDISPYNQDCYAVALIHYVGALEDVIDGRFDEWIAKCGTQWASLPHSPLNDGGSKVAYARAADVWKRYGGATVTFTMSKPPEPAPVEDRSTPARPEDIDRINETEQQPMAAPFLFILPLLQSLFEAFSPVLRAKATHALDKQGVDQATSGAVADALMAIVKQVAGQATQAAGVDPRAVAAASSDPLVAVATVKSSPAMLAQVESQVSDYLDKIAPMIDRMEAMEQGAWKASEDSANAAAARHAARPPEGWDMTRTLVYGMLAMMGFLLLFVAGIAGWQTFKTNAPSTEVWAAVTGLIGFATGIAVTVFAFRFGYSRQSGAKDALLSELATQRR